MSNESAELKRPRTHDNSDPTSEESAGQIVQLNTVADLRIQRIRTSVSSTDLLQFDQMHNDILAMCEMSDCDNMEPVKNKMTFFLLRPYALRLNKTLAPVINATNVDLKKIVRDDPRRLTPKCVQSRFLWNLFEFVQAVVFRKFKKDRTLEIPDDR